MEKPTNGSALLTTSFSPHAANSFLSQFGVVSHGNHFPRKLGGDEAIWIIPLDGSVPPRRLSPGEGFDAAWSRQ
jgi:hypothetical protein